MASEITADGDIIAPLNITHPTPSFNLQGFQWAPVGDGPPTKHRRAVQAQLRDDDTEIPDAPAEAPEHQPPESGIGQGDEQIHQPGGPGSNPQNLLPFPLEQFKGAWAGNGFNLVWVPRQFTGQPQDEGDGPNDARLLLSLTTEQMTFGQTLGRIPNRGFRQQEDIFLHGLPYFQTIQDTTNPETGKGNKPRSDVASGIHFEPGVWLYVPAADFQEGKDTVVRMASIPHGTTINAQGFIPERNHDTVLGGAPRRPTFPTLDTTPFRIGKPKIKIDAFHKHMDATLEKKHGPLRIPADLAAFDENQKAPFDENQNGTGRINTAIIHNPNLVLEKAISQLDIKETIEFTVTTGQPKEKLNAGGTANIAFLAGKQEPVTEEADPSEPIKGVTIQSPGTGDSPNAHSDFMTSTFYIERIEYDVVVGRMDPGTTQILLASLPPGATAPTPRFAITAPPSGVSERKTIKVPGIQIQYSQNVNLNFGLPLAMLTWPHVSVATLVPTDPQPFQMKDEE
jgi:hypothetical protein